MYNRYIPQPDGSYSRNRMEEPRRQEPRHSPPMQEVISAQQEPPCEEPVKEPCPPAKTPPHRQEGPIGGFLKNLLPKDLDTGDLLVILLLLLMAGDCEEDRNSALLTLAIYLFM